MADELANVVDSIVELSISETSGSSEQQSEPTNLPLLAEPLHIMNHIMPMKSLVRDHEKCLAHFQEQIRNISNGVLEAGDNECDVLWKIAEECYNQSAKPLGILDADNYYDSLPGESFEWPYDPDYESELYYQHEDLLNIDKDYAKAFCQACDRRSGNRDARRQTWISFWVDVLHTCPRGPTLFYPPRTDMSSLILPDVPRYLFRAFDCYSPGKNDNNVCASKMSISCYQRSRLDVLSLDDAGVPANMLHDHLNKKSLLDAEDSDNFTSWSSSLLFVIQYAIYRSLQFNRSPSDLRICVLDTTKFPSGQFARDMCLIREYLNASGLEYEKKKFLAWRLRDTRYDNGEYLSQGLLTHAGRSCVVTLDSLIRAGLYDMFPELAKHDFPPKWTKRVLELRLSWSVEQTTLPEDIQQAIKVASTGFRGLETVDMALLLLTFKNRGFLAGSTSNIGRTTNGDGPSEVQQYLRAADIASSIRRRNASDFRFIEKVFEISQMQS